MCFCVTSLAWVMISGASHSQGDGVILLVRLGSSAPLERGVIFPFQCQRPGLREGCSLKENLGTISTGANECQAGKTDSHVFSPLSYFYICSTHSWFCFLYWGHNPSLNCVYIKSLQLCPTLCDPMDCSPQSKNTGVSCHGNLPNSGIEPTSLMSPALAGEFFTTSTTWEAHLGPDSITLYYPNTFFILFRFLIAISPLFT